MQKTENELLEGIKITDINNNEKTEFSQNEKFKILIPIKNLTTEGNFNIAISTKIKSKPVLYGQAPNSLEQDYALTTAIYEDATGKTNEEYYKNETKVKIVTQDQETKERLENVEFNIYDSNKNLINSNGEVEIPNFLPGKYYIQETSAKDGYILNNQLIEFNISFNQRLTITVNNLFKNTPKNDTEEKETTETIEQIEIKKEEPQTENKNVIVTQEETQIENKNVIVTQEETQEESQTENKNDKETKEKLPQTSNENVAVKKLPVTGM